MACRLSCESCSFPSSPNSQRLLRLSWSLAIKARSSSTVALSSEPKPKDSKMLPFSAMPGPKGTIRNILGYALSKGSHFEVVTKRFEKFGPIYSEQLLDTRIVNISDVDAMTKVLRTEKNFQMRPGFEAVTEIIDELEDGKGFNLTSNDYEKWYRDRSVLSPKLLRPKDVNEQLPVLNTVASDFVERLHLLRTSDRTINNIEEELSYWSVESSSSFFFNRRLGFYNHPPDPTVVVFVDAALKMVTSLGKILHSDPFYKYIPTPAYNTLKKSLITMNASCMEILGRLATKQEKDGSTEKQSLFEHLSANGKVTRESVSIVAMLMAAGIDTTSTTCLWLLYLLSRHQDIQEKLYQELLSVLGPDGELSASKIPSYLKAALKESQRMYPVAALLPRLFNEDIELHGYNIPAGVNIFFQNHLPSVDERYYGEDSKQFVPERWLRDIKTGKKQKLNPCSSLPFGFGVRMCLGRRVAESLIYTLVSKILLSYRLEYAGETETNQVLMGGLMKPDQQILLKFIPR